MNPAMAHLGQAHSDLGCLTVWANRQDLARSR